MNRTEVVSGRKPTAARIGRTLRRAAAAGTMSALATAGLMAGPGKAEDSFIRGSGRAEARGVKIGPSAGRLTLAPTVGLSMADYVESVARGESRVADYAALDDSIPTEVKTLAPSVRVDSREEGADKGKTKTIAGTPDGLPVQIGGTRQEAKAVAKTPEGTSRFALGEISLPGVIEVKGIDARTKAGIVDGKTREAIGTTVVGEVSLGGGAVVLRGLRWEAVQRSGAADAVTATFTVEGVTANGAAIPVPAGGAELDAVLAPINTALAPIGMTLTAPRVFTEAGVARVTGLGVTIADSPTGKTVIAPVLGGIQPVREPITQALIDASPEFKTAILLADVAVGIVSGASRLDLEVGGAMAFTEGEAFDNPFAFDLGSGAALADSPLASVDGSSDGATLGGTEGIGGPITSGSTTGSGAEDGGSTNAGGAVRELGAANASNTSSSNAVAVGIAGLLAALATAAADYRRMSAARRMIPA